MFGRKAFKSRCLALRVDFAKNVCISSVVFYALLRWAVVQFAILMRSVGGMLILLLNHVGGGDCYCPPPTPLGPLLLVRLLINLDTACV